LFADAMIPVAFFGMEWATKSCASLSAARSELIAYQQGLRGDI
jgi:hypothetical protein